MTENNIITLARAYDLIDFRDADSDPHVVHVVEFLRRFSILVANSAAEKEREDCAKLLDEMKECAEELMEHPDYSGRFEYERMLALEDAAEAIRNRGKETK